MRAPSSRALVAASLAAAQLLDGCCACDFLYDLDNYVEYFGLNPDWTVYNMWDVSPSLATLAALHLPKLLPGFSSRTSHGAFVLRQCEAACCADQYCDVWQYSDMPPVGMANCMYGVAGQFGDSNGVYWTGAQGRSPGPDPGDRKFRCVNDICVGVVGVPGFPSNETCQEGCGPASCPAALQATCGEAKESGGRDACLICAGVHNSTLVEAGCDKGDYSVFCDVPLGKIDAHQKER
jgi:hypothetical protein